MELISKSYLYYRIVKAKLFIDKNFLKNISIGEIAQEACFSKFHFLRLFKSIYGKTPHTYLTILRIAEAKRQFNLDEVNISKVCYELNFESLTSFSKLFKKHTGISPTNYIKQQKKIRNSIKLEPMAHIPSCYAHNFGWNK